MEINYNFIKFDKGISRDEQISSLEILFNRVSLSTETLFKKEPTLIPFKYKFPIINENEHSVFLKECQKNHLFKDLPIHYIEKVLIAEKINYFNDLFLEYLNNKKLEPTEFKNKNPKTKLDIFYDFLFSKKMDIGILDL